MFLGDEISAALPELRAHAESQQTDRCVVDRFLGSEPSPLPPFDLVDTYGDPIYDGPCRVQRPGGSAGGTEPVVGEQEFGVLTVHFQLPLSAVGIKRGDRVRVTSVDAGSDPDLLELVATVRANLTKTNATKRTLVCEEVA